MESTSSNTILVAIWGILWHFVVRCIATKHGISYMYLLSVPSILPIPLDSWETRHWTPDLNLVSASFVPHTRQLAPGFHCISTKQKFGWSPACCYMEAACSWIPSGELTSYVCASMAALLQSALALWHSGEDEKRTGGSAHMKFMRKCAWAVHSLYLFHVLW